MFEPVYSLYTDIQRTRPKNQRTRTNEYYIAEDAAVPMAVAATTFREENKLSARLIEHWCGPCSAVILPVRIRIPAPSQSPASCLGNERQLLVDREQIVLCGRRSNE